MAAPADRAGIVDMHERCSLETRTARWRAPMRAMPRAYLDDALTGRAGHLCLLAVAGDDVVAVASAVDAGDGRWELGVLVRDDMQRRGIGTCLLDSLVRSVRDRGGTVLVADVAAGRRGVLARLDRHGSRTSTPSRDGIHAQVTLSHGGRPDRTAAPHDGVTALLHEVCRPMHR